MVTRATTTRTALQAEDSVCLGRSNSIELGSGAFGDYPTAGFTWEMEFRTRSHQSRLITKRNGTTGKGFYLLIEGGKLYLQLFAATGSTSIGQVSTTARLNDGQWHRIVVVNDRDNPTAANRKLHLYIDSADSVRSSAALGANYNTDIACPTDTLTVKATGTTDTTAPVCLRNLRHYSRALTAAEVAQVFGDDFDGLPLIGEWPCNDGADTRLMYTPKWVRATVGTVNGLCKPVANYAHRTATRPPVDDSVVLKAMLFSDLHNTADDASLPYLVEIVGHANYHKPDLLVGLGDIGEYDGQTEANQILALQHVATALDAYNGTAYVLCGNHDVHIDVPGRIDRAQFAAALGEYAPISDGKLYHSKEIDGRCLAVFMDAVDDGEGGVSSEQLAWLESTLAGTDLPAVVFFHYRADIDPDTLVLQEDQTLAAIGTMASESAAALRAICESAGNVLVIATGHQHVRHYAKVNGIHHVNIDGSINGPNAQLLTVYANGDISAKGFGTQWGYTRR